VGSLDLELVQIWVVVDLIGVQSVVWVVFQARSNEFFRLFANFEFLICREIDFLRL
jgi:hypothetical protein